MGGGCAAPSRNWNAGGDDAAVSRTGVGGSMAPGPGTPWGATDAHTSGMHAPQDWGMPMGSMGGCAAPSRDWHAGGDDASMSGVGIGGSMAPGTGTGQSQFATLRIERPYSEIGDNVEGFIAQFARAAAQATGIPSARLHIRAVRPGP
eukprot:NODE_20725_length_784_cov_5.662100.p2 GENE.NODE_20725_length_784_cov_5.662100~~NODE_20725_length_784_cov_5.662100.p2  ORF type:complete len:148 (-),score=30.57 NODE_20725_length_784_cov_5.662100:249-692(-)